MKDFYLLLVAVSLATVSFCQQYTLEQAIAEGLKNNMELKMLESEAGLTDLDLSILRTEQLPKISFNGDIRANLLLQKSVLPFQFGPNGVEDGETIIPFGRNFNNYFSLDVEQTIWNPGFKFKKIRYANQNKLKLAEIDIARQSISNEIRDKYFDVAYAKSRVDAQEELTNIRKEWFETISNLANIGSRKESDLLKAEYDLKKSKFQLDKENGSLQNAKNALAKAMKVSNEVNIVPESLEEFSMIHPEKSDLQSSKAILEKLKYEDLSNDVLIQRQEAMPKVSAYGNYTAFQQNNTFNPFAADTWFPYSFIGVRISFPLYDGRLNQRKMERLKQEMVISDLKQSQYDDELKVDIAGLRDIYILTKQELNQIEELLQLSQKIYEQDKIEYDKGSVSYESLLSSKLNLEQHYLDKLSAIERLYQAKSNLDQAALER